LAAAREARGKRATRWTKSIVVDCGEAARALKKISLNREDKSGGSAGESRATSLYIQMPLVMPRIAQYNKKI